MRVLQVHKDFEPVGGGGGTARHIHGLARALATHGCEVRVVAPAVHPVSDPYVSVACAPGTLAPHIAWADVVHVHGARSTYAIRGALAATRGRRPFFYTPHAYYAGASVANNAVKFAWDRTAEKYMAERGAGMILLTPVWRSWLHSKGIATDRTVIIPNCVFGADLAAPTAAVTALAGSPAILSIGRLDPVKRLGDVIRALADAALAAAHLHIVGKGDDRPALEALAAQMDVAERVTFHGFVDDDGVASMVAGADVFVLASEQEGLPTVLLEMLIGRLPVACSRIPGNMAIMDVAGGGQIFEVGDIDGLAQALAAAAATTVTDASVAAIRREFTWEERAVEILDLYRRAVRD